MSLYILTFLFLFCACTLVVLVTFELNFSTGHVAGCILLHFFGIYWDWTFSILESFIWLNCICIIIFGLDGIFLFSSYTSGLANHTTLFGFTGHTNWQFWSSVYFGLTGLCTLSLLVNVLNHLVDWHCLSLHKLDFISIAGSFDCTSLFFMPGFTSCLLQHWVDGLPWPSHTVCSVSWLCLSWQITCSWYFLYFVTGSLTALHYSLASVAAYVHFTFFDIFCLVKLCHLGLDTALACFSLVPFGSHTD